VVADGAVVTAAVALTTAVTNRRKDCRRSAGERCADQHGQR
jgi:hypothetical protein